MADTKINSAGEQQPVDGQSRYAKMSASEMSKELAREAPPKVTGFANKERKNTKHHRHHANEMGYKNQDEYERAGIEFFNSNRGKLYYSKKRKRFYRYNEKTGELAVSSDGTLHTYMLISKKAFNKKIEQEQLYEQ